MTITAVNFLTETSSAAVNAARREIKDFYRPDVTSDDRGDWNAGLNAVLPADDQITAAQRWSRSREIYALLNRPRRSGPDRRDRRPGRPPTRHQFSPRMTGPRWPRPALRWGGSRAGRISRICCNRRPACARSAVRRPAGRVRNILPANTTNITDGAGWSTLRASRAAAPDSATGEPATTVTANETNANGAFLSAGSISLAAGTYTMSAPLKGAGWAMLQVVLSTDAAQQARAWFNLGSGSVGAATMAGAAFSAVSSGIVAVGDGYRCRITFTIGSPATFLLRFYAVDGDASIAVTSGASFRIEAPQFQVGSVDTAYQRRVSAFDVTEAGVRDLFVRLNSTCPTMCWR
jgi:hypothetical protein